MHIVRLGAAALNQTPLDWTGNRERILAATRALAAQGCQVACLPELAVTGYGCEDMFFSPEVMRLAWQSLEAIIADAPPDILLAVGIPVPYGNGIFNGVALYARGRLYGIALKQNLASDGVHYESRWFRPWPKGRVVPYETSLGTVPLGDVTFHTADGLGIGFEICEDAWSAHRPGADLTHRHVDVILNPSASHFAFGKQEVRRRLVTEGARAYGMAYVYTNLLGNEAGRIIYDGAIFIAADGQMLAEGPRFSFADHSLCVADVDVEVMRTGRIRRISFRPEDESREGRCEIPVVLPSREPWAVRQRPELHFPETKEEEFTRAVALGLWDYMRKSRSWGYAISLSGGADSAAVAVLCRMMQEFARAELGQEAMLRRVAYMRPDAVNPARLITCAYQSTRNSSQVTREAARAVAEGVGATFLELDVDALVEGYKSVVAEALGRTWSWERDDLSLQNIQARTRSPSIWMVANTLGAILLSTSNRSEAAVGYATMDGDTSGGLSPLSGIDKAFLRRWLLWMEHTGPQDIGPVPALARVNAQQPTAELRPCEEGQTDEGDLMPYPVLDAIEGLAIRDKKGPMEVFAFLRARQAEPDDVLLGWIERFFGLWCRNQWKRERYAPGFHLDDKNLDPRSWCRFPILSGGYAEELAGLRAHVQARRLAVTAGERL